MGAGGLIRNNKRYVILNLLIIALSVINYNSEFVKFIFSGHSATYGVEIIRFPAFIFQTIAGIVLTLSLFYVLYPRQWIRKSVLIFVFIWGYFMQTAAYNGMNESIDMGWSFIKFRSCGDVKVGNEAKIGSCFLLFDPYIKRKLTEVLEGVR